MTGNTSATTALPTPLPPKPKHHSIWATIVVAVVAVVATVLTAGVLGMAAGAVISSFGSLFTAGITVLGGGTMATMAGTLAAGFTAGFVGSIASQGAANALGMQQGIDLTGALISGLATAATAGISRAALSAGLQSALEKMNNLEINKGFSLSSASQTMEENALSQGLNTAFRKHQHFDWEDLGIAGLTSGVLSSNASKNIGNKLGHIDYNTGILDHELKSLARAGINSTITGNHFDAAQVLIDNLGTAVGNAVGNLSNTLSTIGSDIKNAFTPHDTPPLTVEDLSLANDLKEMEAQKRAFNNYLARQLEEDETYGDYEYTASPANESNTRYLYGSELSGYTGHVIYDDSERFDGKGMFAHDQVLQLINREDYAGFFSILPVRSMNTTLLQTPKQLFLILQMMFQVGCVTH